MRASDLQRMEVRDQDGRRLGRVAELHIRDGVITTLVVGPLGLLQRFTSSRAGRRISWRTVMAVDDGVIRVARGKPRPTRGAPNGRSRNSPVA